jgi:predicted MFS family arabinose efflux permease
MALLFDTLKAAGREHQYERLAGRGVALGWAGVGIATAFGGPVAALSSTRATIFVGAATCLLTAAVAIAIWEPPHPRDEAEQKPSYWRSIGEAFAEAWSAVDVRIVIALAGTAFAALEAVHYLVQPYLIDRDIEVGLVFSLLQVPMLLAGFGGALIAERVVSKFGARAFVIGPMLGAGCYLALSASPGLAAYAALPLIMAVSSVVEPLATGFINRRIGSERRATVLSIASMVRSLVMAALAPALGFTVDQWGMAESFALGGVIALAGGLVFGIPLAIRAMRQPPGDDGLVEASAAG